MPHVTIVLKSGHLSVPVSKSNDPRLHPNCPANTLPDHVVANMIAKMFGDYPRSYKYGSLYPEVKGMAEYLEIARNKCTVEITTSEMNTESIGNCKGNSMNPSSVKDTLGFLLLDGVRYPTRSTPSLLTLWEVVGSAERYRLEKMFSAVAGVDYKTHYGLGKLISMCRDAYRDHTCDAVRAYLDADDLPDGVDNLSRKDGATFLKNSIVEPIKTGKLRLVGSNHDSAGQAFRLEGSARLVRMRSTTVGTPKKVRTVYGYLHLDLTDAQYDTIMKHGRFAVFLDGGTATVSEDYSGDYWSAIYDQYPKCYITDAK